MRRRTLLWGAPVLAFAGCASGTTTSTALAGAVDAAKTIISSFLAEAPLLSALVPNILPPATLSVLTNPGGTGYLDLAQTDLTALLTTMGSISITDAAGASALDTIEDYLNMAVHAVGPVLTVVATTVPGLAEAQSVVQDIVLALPIVEAFVNSVVPAAPVASSHLALARAQALPMAGKLKPSAYAALALLKARE